MSEKPTAVERVAYVAKCSCGGMVMVTTNEHPHDAATEVAECIIEGYRIETVSIEDARQIEFCKHHGQCGKTRPALAAALLKEEKT